MRFGWFGLLTFCGFLVFALTMTFAPVLPIWLNYVGRASLLLALGVLWWGARGSQRLAPFRPVLFAYFTAVVGLSLGFFFADPILGFFGLTTRTPAGIAVAKLSQALLVVIGVFTMAKLCGEDLASLYVRAGRLIFGLGVGLIGAAACLALALQQPAVRALGAGQGGDPADARTAFQLVDLRLGEHAAIAHQHHPRQRKGGAQLLHLKREVSDK